VPQALEPYFIDWAVANWFVALVVAAFVCGAIYLARVILLRYLARGGSREVAGISHPALYKVVRRTNALFALGAGLYIGGVVALLPANALLVLRWFFVIAAFLQVALWLDQLALLLVDRRFGQRAGNAGARSAAGLVRFVARVAVWSLVLLLVLANLGVDITALIAGLGIGGIAVALAAQNILGDLFASLAIILDRPFEVGDFIVVGEQLGTVEHIGVKTTHLRSLSGEQLICSNTDLLTSRVQNYARMQERRVVLTLGVVYETPTDKIAMLPDLIREIVTAQEQIRFDRAHFRSFGDFALIFEVVYWVLSADYNLLMDKQQAINLEILRRFRERGLEFAFPTQTLHLNVIEDG
jgi:small-conductance mechanosensitive channel